jgi:hypothetical protein
VVDPVNNQLLYELFGTVYDATNETFTPPHFPPIHRSMIRRCFGADEIRNHVNFGGEINHFLDVTNVAVVRLPNSDSPVGLLGTWPNWEGMDSQLYADIEIASWRYNSSNPKYNPKRFDLWLEIKTSQTNIIVKNW